MKIVQGTLVNCRKFCGKVSLAMKKRRLPVPQRVLITRLSAIGDCILTIPTAVRAKQLWPDCELTWIVECGAYQLLEQHPAIDEVLRIEPGWLKRPGEWMALRRELRNRDFDLVLDPQGLTKSAMLGWFSGSRTRVGFDYTHARELAPLLANRRVQRTARHMVDSYLQVLSPWTDIRPGEGEFQMPVYGPEALTASRMVSELGLANHPWIALNPGAGWSTRLWPVQRFGMLARELFRERGIRSLVFWSGESELLLAKVIEEVSCGAATVAPKTSLTEMLELLRHSTLMVTGDTGPLHMASAVGTPCVSLHGPTWSDVSGPYGNRHIAIQSPSPQLSKKLVRKGPNIAMQAIELDEVYRACCEMLSGNVAQIRSTASTGNLQAA